LENKEITDIIREAYDKDDVFHDSNAYLCDANENFSLKLLSLMNWYSVDPRSKLLYFIREEERGLCIPRSPELIHLIMHELHVVPLGTHSGFMKV